MLKNLIFISIFSITSFCTNNTSSTIAEENVSFNDSKTELLFLVNQLRKNGCRCGRKKMRPAPPVKWNNLLEQSALTHAKDMARNNFFEHIGSDGSSISDRISKTGYNWQMVGENIFWGDASAKEVFKGWKDSPSHCKNMMDKNFREMGGYVQ